MRNTKVIASIMLPAMSIQSSVSSPTGTNNVLPSTNSDSFMYSTGQFVSDPIYNLGKSFGDAWDSTKKAFEETGNSINDHIFKPIGKGFQDAEGAINNNVIKPVAKGYDDFKQGYAYENNQFHQGFKNGYNKQTSPSAATKPILQPVAHQTSRKTFDPDSGKVQNIPATATRQITPQKRKENQNTAATQVPDIKQNGSVDYYLKLAEAGNPSPTQGQ